MDPIIIIGTGIAAYTLAREFRKCDADSPLILISADDGSSYPKPMLSNALAKGKTAEQIALFDAQIMAEKLNAEIKTFTKVDSIDKGNNKISLSTGQILKYSKLILAIGAAANKLTIDGDAKDEILSINDLADYSLFRQKLEGAKHVAIIGPGLIACEFANDLASIGITSSIVGPSSQLMMGLLPEAIAEELANKLTDLGVTIHLETTTESISHNNGLYKIVLGNGSIVEADIVLSAIGLRSRTELALTAGLATNRGIITNEYLQTSAEDIYALGDCAEVVGHNLLYIAPITAAAKALAKTLSGIETVVTYPAMPVAIKTPCYPLVVAPPLKWAAGQWNIETADSGFGKKASFHNESNELLGFVLSGDLVTEKRNMASQMSNLL